VNRFLLVSNQVRREVREPWGATRKSKAQKVQAEIRTQREALLEALRTAEAFSDERDGISTAEFAVSWTPYWITVGQKAKECGILSFDEVLFPDDPALRIARALLALAVANAPPNELARAISEALKALSGEDIWALRHVFQIARDHILETWEKTLIEGCEPSADPERSVEPSGRTKDHRVADAGGLPGDHIESKETPSGSTAEALVPRGGTWADEKINPSASDQVPETLGEALDCLGTPTGLCSLVGIRGRSWAKYRSLKPHLGTPVYSRPRTAGYYRVRQFLRALRAVNTKESVEWLANAAPEDCPIDSRARATLRPKDWKPSWATAVKPTADLRQI